MGERVIVCGGRRYYDAEKVNATLDALHAARPFEVVIQGGAGGADALADAWTLRSGVPMVEVRADWEMYGPGAGPIRNGQMLNLRPTLVVAFPGGRGTADMVWRAREADVEVIEVSGPPAVVGTEGGSDA